MSQEQAAAQSRQCCSFAASSLNLFEKFVSKPEVTCKIHAWWGFFCCFVGVFFPFLFCFPFLHLGTLWDLASKYLKPSFSQGMSWRSARDCTAAWSKGTLGLQTWRMPVPEDVTEGRVVRSWDGEPQGWGSSPAAQFLLHQNQRRSPCAELLLAQKVEKTSCKMQR